MSRGGRARRGSVLLGSLLLVVLTMGVVQYVTWMALQTFDLWAGSGGRLPVF